MYLWTISHAWTTESKLSWGGQFPNFSLSQAFLDCYLEVRKDFVVVQKFDSSGYFGVPKSVLFYVRLTASWACDQSWAGLGTRQPAPWRNMVDARTCVFFFPTDTWFSSPIFTRKSKSRWSAGYRWMINVWLLVQNMSLWVHAMSKVRRGRGPASARGVDNFARRLQALAPRPRSTAHRPHPHVHTAWAIVHTLLTVARTAQSATCLERANKTWSTARGFLRTKVHDQKSVSQWCERTSSDALMLTCSSLNIYKYISQHD